MFHQSELGEKCNCGEPETVRKEYKFKRYLLPAGYYGGLYQPSGYYSALWMTLHCPKCGNVRDNIHIYRWAGKKGYYPIIPPFAKEGAIERAKDIRQKLISLMDE